MDLEFLTQEIEKARLVYQSAPAIGKEALVKALNQRGDYYLRQGQDDLAMADYLAAKKIDQNFPANPIDPNISDFFSELEKDQAQLEGKLALVSDESAVTQETSEEISEAVDHNLPNDTKPYVDEAIHAKERKAFIPIIITVLIVMVLILAGIFYVLQRNLRKQAQIFTEQTSDARFFATATAQIEMTQVVQEWTKAVEEFDGFSFGLGGVSNDCVVNEITSQISQKDLFMEEFLYFSSTIQEEAVGEMLYWSVISPSGEVLIGDVERELEDDLCFWQGFSLDSNSEPGTYFLEVVFRDFNVYTTEFEIKAYDLSLIERPDRDPFGEITFGRGGINDDCEVNYSAGSTPIGDLDEDPWFYFSAPYQMADIGVSFYWFVINDDGEILYSGSPTIEDSYDLCFWRGFSMSDEPKGEYIIIFEFEDGHQRSYNFFLE